MLDAFQTIQKITVEWNIFTTTVHEPKVKSNVTVISQMRRTIFSVTFRFNQP